MKRRSGALLVLAALAAAPSAAGQPFDAELEAHREAAHREAAHRATEHARANEDAERVVWAGALPAPRGTSTAEAARHHLERYAERIGAPARAARRAEIEDVHDVGRGAIIVRFEQRAGGTPGGMKIAGGGLSLAMTRDRELVSIAGSLYPDSAGEQRFAIPAEQAISRALEDRYGAAAALAPAPPARRGGARAEPYEHYEIIPASRNTGYRLLEPARAKRILYPLRGELVPAYALHFVTAARGADRPDGAAYIMAAEDGAILRRHSLSAEAAFAYRVWARDDAYHTPYDGPHGSANPHPTGEPEDRLLAFIDPIDVSTRGFNTNPEGEPDPWLPADAEVTRGNNVHAYADHTYPDGFNEGDDVQAEVTDERAFLHTYDPHEDPLEDDEQVMASVTQLFYINNWLHNWYYDSGFDEAAGNAQLDNYGRGGVEGDPLLAEAQDFARTENPPRNNANILVPPEGQSPRMQMYIWDGPTEAEVEALGRELDPVGTAAFGPANFDREEDVVLVDDGSTETDTDDDGSVTDACNPIENDLSGAIALADRGGCTFVTKALHAEEAGAEALLVANDEPEGVVPMAQGEEPIDVGIPALMITKEDGEALREALPTQARIVRDSTAPERDGTLDNIIAAHEWGHYLHFRLVDDCQVTQQCRAMSEGFADFVALHMSIAEEDDLRGAHAVGQYAAGALLDNVYFGVRRAPYSTNPDINALTFGHIERGAELPEHHPIAPGPSPDNFQIHNAGEIWGNALLEAYAALLRDRGHDFEEARRRMSDYLVAGMKAAPPAPTYTEQARALLAAVRAADPDDFDAMAAALARRGLGSGASSPPRYSTDFTGVTERFGTEPELRLASSELGDDLASCDDDGVLDITETGNLWLAFENVGYGELEGGAVTVTTDEPALSFPEGDTATLDALAPIATDTVELPVEADDTLPDLARVEFEVSVEGAGGAERVFATEELLNYDVVENASTTDRVDSPVSAWSSSDRGLVSDVWQRVGHAEDASWHAQHIPAHTDSRLVSPELEVGATNRLTIGIRHRYRFASGPIQEDGPDVHFGGGVIEVRKAGGEWKDAADWADPDYGGPISLDGLQNPLEGREGYVGESAGYPGFDETTLDFGRAFAGETVQIRFRIGSGQGFGAAGWEIDEIGVSGISNTPFHELQPEGGDCATQGPPGGCASGGGAPLGAAALTAAALFSLRRLRPPRAPERARAPDREQCPGTR